MRTKEKEHMALEEQDETLEEDPDECYRTRGEDSGEDKNKHADSSRVEGERHEKLYRITSATEDPDASMDMVPHSDNSGVGGVAGVSAVVVSPGAAVASPITYESQKRRDWNTFLQYLRNHRPGLSLARCSGAHVLEFIRYLDQFGKTKVHTPACPFYGNPAPPAPCPCPLRQAWGSLDALVGRLRAAYEENGGRPESNPFVAREVRLYLREVREHQARARGVSYDKKRRKPPHPA